MPVVEERISGPRWETSCAHCRGQLLMGDPCWRDIETGMVFCSPECERENRKLNEELHPWPR